MGGRAWVWLVFLGCSSPSVTVVVQQVPADGGATLTGVRTESGLDAAPPPPLVEDGGTDGPVEAASPANGDAGPDAGCEAGANRCSGNQAEACVAGGVWQTCVGANCAQCCTDPNRWTLTTTEAHDVRTGLTWRRQSIQGPPFDLPACGDAGAWRWPTRNELYGLIIGSQNVCNPTIDHVAFPGASGGTYYGTDGNVDMYAARLTSGPAQNALCVK